MATHLGGDNLDQRIIDWIIAEFKKQEGIDLGRDRMALRRLKGRRRGEDGLSVWRPTSTCVRRRTRPAKHLA